jgi:DNA polymerase I-like protein with 3'-5' exonuclease and polymerase domains
MGNYALQAFTNETGITNWRGSVLDGDIAGRKIKFIITFNPAYVLREPKWEPIFKMDMHKLGRVINGAYKPHEIEATINPSLNDVLDNLKRLASAKNPVALDIETTGREVACIGLADSSKAAMCINLRDRNSNRFTMQEEITIWKSLQDTLNKCPIIAQNGIFDSYYCWLKSFLKFDCFFDTMLAHHTLFPQLPHSLAFIVSQYTTHPFYKDEGKQWKEGGDIDAFWRYNCKDAALTYDCYEKLTNDLRKHKLYDFFMSHVMRLQPHLVQATVHGVLCDVELKEQLVDIISEDIAKQSEAFQKLVFQATKDKDYHINPNSNHQLRELFFETLKLRGRGTSVDETNRKRILNDSRTSPTAREMIVSLNKYKKDQKFLSTYMHSEVDADHRIRTTYKQHGVSKAPGRLSSSQTADGTGMNLQNQPQRAYEIFLADPKCVFIYLDGSQAEARIVGTYYDIEKWKEDFEKARIDRSYDCHRALASEMFKIPYNKVPKEDYDKAGNRTVRYTAKRCRHGLNYRMQPDRLAEVTDLPFYEARRAHFIYHQITPELRRGWKKEEEKVKRSRELYNAYGRRWKVIQRIDDTVLESIIAFYPQSTMGDHVCRAWYLAEEDPRWPKGKARIAMNNHDALIGIAEPSVAKTALSIMKQYMEAPILITNLYSTKTEELIIPAECKISVPDKWGLHRWSTLKKIEL